MLLLTLSHMHSGESSIERVVPGIATQTDTTGISLETQSNEHEASIDCESL